MWKSTVAVLIVFIALLAPDFSGAEQARPGRLDRSFGGDGVAVRGFGLEPATGGALQALPQADGKTLLLHSAAYGFSLARVLADGSPDHGFGEAGFVAGDFGAPLSAQVVAMALQPDGKILVAGSFESALSISRPAVSRFLPDGSLDRSFGEDGSARFVGRPELFGGAEEIAVVPGGKILLVGRGTGNVSGLEIARLTPDGRLDRSFGKGGFSFTPLPRDFIGGAPDAAVSPGGELTVSLGGSGTTKILRFFADGRPNQAFGGDGAVDTTLLTEASDVALDGAARVLLVGAYGKVVRFLPDGSADPGFGRGGLATHEALEASPGPNNASADRIAVTADGQIVLAGAFEDRAAPTQPSDFLVARLTDNGALDPSYAGGTGFRVTDFGGNKESVSSLALLPDGRALLAGATGAPGSQLHQIALARYDADGNLDLSFGQGGTAAIRPRVASDDLVSGVIVDPLGRTVAVGQAGGKITVVRYLQNGKPDPGFGLDGAVRSSVTAAPFGDRAESLARLEDGRLLVGSGSAEGGALLAYRPDGELAPSFGGEGIVRSSLDHVLDLHALRGGGFLAVGLIRRSCESVLARFNPNGDPDLRFGHGSGRVRLFAEGGPCQPRSLKIARQPDGHIVVSGEGLFVGQFTAAGERVESFRQRKRSTFFPYLPGLIRALAVDRQGRILLGGSSREGENRVFTITRLTATGRIDSSFGDDATVHLKLGNRASAESIDIEPSGRILVAGSAQRCASPTSCAPSRAVAVRLMPDGSRDHSFAKRGLWSSTYGFGAAVTATALGKGTLTLGGWSISSGQDRQFLLARLQARGVDAMLRPMGSSSLSGSPARSGGEDP